MQPARKLPHVQQRLRDRQPLPVGHFPRHHECVSSSSCSPCPRDSFADARRPYQLASASPATRPASRPARTCRRRALLLGEPRCRSSQRRALLTRTHALLQHRQVLPSRRQVLRQAASACGLLLPGCVALAPLCLPRRAREPDVAVLVHSWHRRRLHRHRCRQVRQPGCPDRLRGGLLVRLGRKDVQRLVRPSPARTSLAPSSRADALTRRSLQPGLRRRDVRFGRCADELQGALPPRDQEPDLRHLVRTLSPSLWPSHVLGNTLTLSSCTFAATTTSASTRRPRPASAPTASSPCRPSRAARTARRVRPLPPSPPALARTDSPLPTACRHRLHPVLGDQLEQAVQRRDRPVLVSSPRRRNPFTEPL